jgi:hypothetical protein
LEKPSNTEPVLLFQHALAEFIEIDDRPLVRPFADDACLVRASDPEAKTSPIDGDQLHLGRDRHARRGGGDMADIDMRADRALFVGESISDIADRTPI